MRLRPLALAGGVAVTTFVLVAVAVIEIVRVDPGAGILGVALGAIAAGVAFAAVAVRPRSALGPPGPVEAVAAFGWTLFLLLALSYVNAPGARSLDGSETAGAALLVAALVGAAAWFRERQGTTGHEGPT